MAGRNGKNVVVVMRILVSITVFKLDSLTKREMVKIFITSFRDAKI